MSVSLEALAMAGMDSSEWGMEAEEWERNDLENHIPPHLLADQEEDEDADEEHTTSSASNYKFPAAGLSSSCRRKDESAAGVYCLPAIMCHFSRIIEKRASGCLSSVGIVVRAMVGFLMVITMKIMSAQRSKP